MDFNTTEEQTMLRETVARYLADTYSFDNRMKTVHGGQGLEPGSLAGLRRRTRHPRRALRRSPWRPRRRRRSKT